MLPDTFEKVYTPFTIVFCIITYSIHGEILGNRLRGYEKITCLVDFLRNIHMSNF